MLFTVRKDSHLLPVEGKFDCAMRIDEKGEHATCDTVADYGHAWRKTFPVN